jgi:hypothetical protein
MPIRLAALLLPLLAVPALAADDLTDADRVAAIMIGFTGDGTAMVEGHDTANVTRIGPGRFTATIEETGAPLTFDVLETAPCAYEATYVSGEMTYVVALDFGKVKGATFVEGEGQTGYTLFDLQLDAPAGTVETVRPDGTRRPVSNRTEIGTSLTLAELDAAVAALLKTCSAP